MVPTEEVSSQHLGCQLSAMGAGSLANSSMSKTLPRVCMVNNDKEDGGRRGVRIPYALEHSNQEDLHVKPPARSIKMRVSDAPLKEGKPAEERR